MTNPCNGHIEPIKVFCRAPKASLSLIHFDLITLRAAGTGAIADFLHPTRRYAVSHKPQTRITGLFPLPATAWFFYKQWQRDAQIVHLTVSPKAAGCGGGFA